MQETLLPEPLELKGVNHSYHYQSADQTGGDWFSHFHDKRGQRLFVFIGDVVGHGVASALVTGVVCGAIRSYFAAKPNFESLDPETLIKDLLEACDTVIAATGARADRVMAMAILALDLRTGQVTY